MAVVCPVRPAVACRRCREFYLPWPYALHNRVGALSLVRHCTCTKERATVLYVWPFTRVGGHGPQHSAACNSADPTRRPQYIIAAQHTRARAHIFCKLRCTVLCMLMQLEQALRQPRCSLVIKYSRTEECVANQTFGCNDNASEVWTADGCRGLFTCAQPANGANGTAKCANYKIIKGKQTCECKPLDWRILGALRQHAAAAPAATSIPASPSTPYPTLTGSTRCALITQYSRTINCVANQTYGCNDDGSQVWTADGCRGKFACAQYPNGTTKCANFRIATGKQTCRCEPRDRSVLGCLSAKPPTEYIDNICAEHRSRCSNCTVQRQMPVIMLHVSHGAGTFLHYQALAHCEAALDKSPCQYQAGSMRGDLPTWPPVRRSCIERRTEMTRLGLGFAGIERGLLDGEFCPDQFHYVLLMRNPIDRMVSLASTPTHALRANASTVIAALQQQTLTVPGYQDYFKKHVNSKVGWGMSYFDNAYTRHLGASSSIFYKPLGTIDESDYAAALKTLGQFSLVLTTDLLKENRPLAEQLLARPPLSWKFGLFPVASNHHARRVFDALTPKQRDVLVQHNAWDLKLWASLREKERQASSAGHSNAEG